MSKLVVREAQNYAAILDAEFDAIARLAEINAGIFKPDSTFEDQILFSILSNTIKSTPIIHGAGFIFSDVGKQYQSPSTLYLYEDKTNFDELIKLELKNTRLIDQGQWYLNAKKTKKTVWSEPYIADALDDTLKTTVATPFLKTEIF